MKGVIMISDVYFKIGDKVRITYGVFENRVGTVIDIPLTMGVPYLYIQLGSGWCLEAFADEVEKIT